MSKVDVIRALYDYNEHANNRILDAAAKLTADDLVRQHGASFDSVEGNLGHVVGAQMAWLQRWTTGGNTQPTTLLGAISGLEALSRAYERSHADLRRFLDSSTEERLEGVLAYTDSRGNAFKRVLWQLLPHVANHSSYHRAETAMALTAMGHDPGDLDYVFFEIERDGKVRGPKLAGM